VLTKEQGKMNLVISSFASCHRLWPGSLISFSPEKFSNTLKNSHSFQSSHERIDILYVPSVLTGHRLSLIHHILEFCYYFFPLHEPCEPVFELLMRIIQVTAHSAPKQYEILLQRLCIVELLSYSGFFIPEEFVQLQYLFRRICGKAVDEANAARISLTRILETEEDVALICFLDAWILKALQKHPNFNFFKTILFIYK
jgi:hypothetical protein